MSKIDSDKFVFFIINICLIAMGIVISTLLLSISVFLIDGVIDIIWDKPCVCEGVGND
jgi:hypothetical protein